MTYKDKYPEFLEETMFADHGTRVLITDVNADKYLIQSKQRQEQAKLKKLREQSPQWFDDNQGQ